MYAWCAHLILNRIDEAEACMNAIHYCGVKDTHMASNVFMWI